jgi:hypothetical protein
MIVQQNAGPNKAAGKANWQKRRNVRESFVK